jgi:sigma-B regulation protein RsbU (phosphoserine phosphatase)
MVIGDVAGRGIAAALYMARLISDFRAAAHRTASPRETLERLNQQLLARSTRGLFVTMAYMVLDPASGELCYSNGGHLPALRRDGRTHRVELLGDDQGLPLGISAWPELRERRLMLEPQDALLWVTDGIVEGLSDRAVDFRLDPLLGLFQKCRSSDDKIVDVIFDEVGRVSESRPPEDDMTVLFLAWRPRPVGPV